MRKKIVRDERGMLLVFVATGFMAFFGATMLAIDVGNLMVARSQAQNAADAGALSGAGALVFDDPLDQSASGPAVQSALSAATANQVMNYDVSVTPPDVTFPTADQVRVNVFRTGGRGNPISTLVAAYFGIPNADVEATATAEAAPANAGTCIKPWAVPDKFTEVQTPAWDPDDTFDMFVESGPNKGDPMPNPDIYVPADQMAYTGCRPEVTGPDYGLQVTLKPGNPAQAINPGHFFPIALPPNTGAAWYQENIPSCWPDVMTIGEMVPVEPGNMTGPTRAGTEDLIAQDPGAYWDDAEWRVVSSYNPSPRLVILPVFDPIVYETSRQSGRQDMQIANLVGFFIESVAGNNVMGRVVPATGLIRSGTPVPMNSFLKAIRLVE